MTTLRIAFSTWLLQALAAGLSAGVIGGADVRIGADDGVSGARSAIIDFDPDSGNYYAVVEWSGEWGFFISTDGGNTWTSNYSYNCFEDLAGLDMAVSGAWVYVGYACPRPQVSEKATMRRFDLESGDLDTGYSGGGSHELADIEPLTVVDVSIETNFDSGNDRVFYTFIQSDGVVRTFWDTTTDGTSFTEVPIIVSDAVTGLDLHWNAGFTTYSLFLSLLDEQDNIQVWRYNGSWGFATSFPYSGSQPRTAISAAGDQIAVAYLAPATHGQGVQYRQSSNGGSTWAPATFVAAPSAGAGAYLDVDITARGGNGLALVFNHEAGDEDFSMIQFKPSLDPGPWTEARSFSDFDPVTGRQIALNWVAAATYSVGYVGGDNAFAYFDQVVSPAIFLDGFENGSSDAWTTVVP